LLAQSPLLLTYWQRTREGQWTRATFQWKAGQLRRSFQQELARGARCRCPKTAATCLELIVRKPALWTFPRVEGVEQRTMPQKGASGTRCCGAGAVTGPRVTGAVALWRRSSRWRSAVSSRAGTSWRISQRVVTRFIPAVLYPL